jgi:hypothetical protein
MIDREKVVTVLRRRFPGATHETVAAAANAIVGLPDEWEDITPLEPDLSAHLAYRCGEHCVVFASSDEGAEFRLFRRRDV